MTAVFDRDIPAPSDSYFTNGERALGVNTVIGDEATGTYRLAKWVNLPPGVYNIKAMLSPSGTLAMDGVMIGGSTLITTQIDVPAGERRIDITLTKTSPGEKCYAAFLIFRSDKVIYASDGDGWVFDTAPIADEDIPAADDPRLALPVFGVLPNWANGISERVSYLTDILTSETGAEQRRTLREHPRRSIEANFLRDNLLRARLDAFLVGVGASDFMVPLWHEQFRTNGVAAFEVFHQFPTTGDTLHYREFAANDLVLVTTGDPRTHEVLIVDTVDPVTGQLTWLTRPSKTWPAGTRLIPLRRAYIPERVSMSTPVDRIGSVQIRFELKDPDTRFNGDWGYCAPLWRFKIDRGTAVTLDYDRTTYTMDNDSGPVIVSNPGNRAHVNSRFSMLTMGRKNLYMLRQFIAAAKGRAVRFYAPSFTRDIEPKDDIEGLYFDAELAGFSDTMGYPQWARRMIAVVFNDGAPTIYRTVVGVSEQDAIGGRVERFVLDAPLPFIPHTKIERIQFVVPSRFDQDGFEFTHLVDESAAVRASLVTRSVDGTGMPPIECDVTSLPYPLETLDSLNTGLVPVLGKLTIEPVTVEGMDTGLTPVSGVLDFPLVSTAIQLESLDAGLTPVSGTLTVPLVTAEPVVESLDTIMAPVSGTLISVYVSYTPDPEGLDVGMAATSGVMSELYSFDMLDVNWDDTEVAWDDLGDI